MTKEIDNLRTIRNVLLEIAKNYGEREVYHLAHEYSEQATILNTIIVNMILEGDKWTEKTKEQLNVFLELSKR